jgi:serine/threonine protein kinase
MMYWVLVREVIPTAMPPSGGDASMLSTLDVADVPDPIPPHEANPMIPKTLSNLILDCVDKDRAKRPDSMEEVIHRLKKRSAPPDPSSSADAG